MVTVTVQQDGGMLMLDGGDGGLLRFHAIWLRDNAWDSATRSPGNGQRLIALRDIPADTRIASAVVAGKNLTVHFAPEGKSVDYDIAWLQGRLVVGQHEPGALIVRSRDPADALYLLVQGEVSVSLPLPHGGHKRLSTLSAGMVFGEAALIAGGQRSADVRADTTVVCWALSTDAFARLKDERPNLAITLLHNLLRSLTETTARLTAEVAALEG